MTLTKTLMTIAAAGFLAACEAGTGGGGMSAGTNDMSLVQDPRVAGMIESAHLNGSTVIYSYYTDVIPNDITALDAADVYCGGAGRSNPPTITESTVGGRTLKTFAFTCR
jgi:hypothetical protein